MAARWDTTRTEAFSDGVFSIAATLLVLDIAVPVSQLHDLWSGIVHEWPAYLAYATSFITIGGMWLAHQSLFSRLQSANGNVVRANLALLMAVAFLPFPTRLVAEALRLHGSGSERAASVFYGVSLLAVACLFSLLWRVVSRDRRLLKPQVGDAQIQAIGEATTPNIAIYGALILIAVLTPRIAAFGYLVLAVVVVMRARGDSSGDR